MKPRRPHRQRSIAPNPHSEFNKAKAARKAKAASKAYIAAPQRAKKQKLGKGQVAPISSNTASGTHGKAMQFCEASDEILLVGEGDLSFTKALVMPPRLLSPGKITSTVYDSREELLSKYPDTADANVKFLEEFSGNKSTEKKSDDEDGYDDNLSDFSDFDNDDTKLGTQTDEKIKLLFNVDATALEKTKHLRKRKFGCIVFNFPHTGSGITDQDRNIRQNQGIFFSFFLCKKYQRQANDSQNFLSVF